MPSLDPHVAQLLDLVARAKRPPLNQLDPADAKIAYTDAARTTSFPAALFVGFGLLASFGLPASRTKRDSPTAE